ncbi:hypothetical protein DT594_16195 [Halopseudomonas laoshanensis]|uniref:Uncharacterized protein n=1 Tax=Halopseudomonas laoshanensis TaxID=2268758 RepID=A0A7V7GSW7_9GAMM|nr:hypothetical protein [Halopseudomonas laoshanensis]KAA0692490.1 hypothetical protein DT594_16195 [Halopseudomonas laoshanensis]
MNTLQSHKEEFASGIVTELGYSAIADAEGYDAASSVGAGSVSITLLWQVFRQGKALSLFRKGRSPLQPHSENELAKWCVDNFPACYEEHLRRAKH